MRVNMDSSMIGDPRFELVAERLGLDVDTVFGKCFRLWLACYERRSICLRRREADVASRCKGFADALIAEELADAKDEDRVIVHGVEERIKFLGAQAEKGRKGGLKGQGKPKLRPSKANAKQTLSKCYPEPKAYSPSPSPSPSPSTKSAGSAGAADPSPSDPQESAPEDPSGKKVDPSKIPAVAHTLAQMLADYIVENLPTGTLAKMVERKRAHRVLTWADTIRLMHSADKHSWDEIQAMLVWSQRSDFWRANVQSGAGLRRNWDQMAAQRVRGKSATATTGQVAATSAAEFEKEPEVSEL